MHLTNREIWALAHGLLIGGLFLLASTGALVALAGLRADYLTAGGIRDRVAALRTALCAMALLAWGVVVIGIWVLVPWYAEDRRDSPKAILLSDPDTRQWHEFADVWKTHVALMAPILATAAAALVVYYGRTLAQDRLARKLVIALVLSAFAVASFAAVVGSLVSRAAPLR